MRGLGYFVNMAKGRKLYRKYMKVVGQIADPQLREELQAQVRSRFEENREATEEQQGRLLASGELELKTLANIVFMSK
jgi:hypothetical protein